MCTGKYIGFSREGIKLRKHISIEDAGQSPRWMENEPLISLQGLFYTRVSSNCHGLEFLAYSIIWVFHKEKPRILDGSLIFLLKNL